MLGRVLGCWACVLGLLLGASRSCGRRWNGFFADKIRLLLFFAFACGGDTTGENHELREELRSPNREVRRDAVKKVIANMTVGKDVSTLFTEVINCIQTGTVPNKAFLIAC